MVLHLMALLALAAPMTTTATATTTATTEPARVVRVAVTDLGTDGVDPRVARIFASSMIYELRKLERVSVLGLDEIRAMLDLEAERQLVGCSEEKSCLAEIADALGADVVIVGSLARVGDTHVVALKSISQGDAQALGTFNKVVAAGDGEELLAEIGVAVAALFPRTPLRVGQTRGVSKELARRLSPPPLPTPVTVGVGVVGVGLLVGAGVAAIVQQQTYGEYTQLAERSRSTPTSGALLIETGERAVLAEQVGWALLAGGAAVAVITAAMVPFTDFDNLRALEQDETQP